MERVGRADGEMDVETYRGGIKRGGKGGKGLGRRAGGGGGWEPRGGEREREEKERVRKGLKRKTRVARGEMRRGWRWGIMQGVGRSIEELGGEFRWRKVLAPSRVKAKLRSQS